MFHHWGSEIRLLILALVLSSANIQAQSGFKSEDELIRSAEREFNDKNYEKAFPLFSQIVSNRPENAHYNYCLGVCIMKASTDKAEAVRFLDVATKSPQNPSDSWLYLGMALHSSYRYEEAIGAFENYKLNAGRSAWNSIKGDLLIKMCRNGIDAKNDLSLQRHRILEKQTSERADFFTQYKNVPEAGRFLKLPKEYEDKNTKGSDESAYLFLPPNGNTIVYANTSKNNDKGYDIFKVLKDQKGLWMFPEMLSDIINSSGDEAFPVVINDGKTLFFSSKGERSTGGYDIFRSDLDPSTGNWSEPLSMGPPVNSPDDDFYYLPTTDKNFAYFSSNRESASGKCNVYKAAIIKEDRNFVTINGFFNCSAGLDLSDAKVTIMNPDDKSIIAQFRTPSHGGDYHLKLPVPSKFLYQVELAGFNSQQELVDLSTVMAQVLIQEILLVRTDDAKEKMTITNRVPVDDKVVAGNKSKANLSIEQNVNDRDMAMAVAPGKNLSSQEKKSASGISEENQAQTNPISDSEKTVNKTPDNPVAKSNSDIKNDGHAERSAESLASNQNSTSVAPSINLSSKQTANSNSAKAEDKVEKHDTSNSGSSVSSAKENTATVDVNNQAVAGNEMKNNPGSAKTGAENKTTNLSDNDRAVADNIVKTHSDLTTTHNNATTSEVHGEEVAAKQSQNNATATKVQPNNTNNGVADNGNNVGKEEELKNAELPLVSVQKVSSENQLVSSEQKDSKQQQDKNSGKPAASTANSVALNSAANADESKNNSSSNTTDKAVAHVSVDKSGNINVSEIGTETKSNSATDVPNNQVALSGTPDTKSTTNILPEDGAKTNAKSNLPDEKGQVRNTTESVPASASLLNEKNNSDSKIEASNVPKNTSSDLQKSKNINNTESVNNQTKSEGTAAGESLSANTKNAEGNTSVKSEKGATSKEIIAVTESQLKEETKATASSLQGDQKAETSGKVNSETIAKNEVANQVPN